MTMKIATTLSLGVAALAILGAAALADPAVPALRGKRAPSLPQVAAPGAITPAVTPADAPPTAGAPPAAAPVQEAKNIDPDRKEVDTEGNIVNDTAPAGNPDDSDSIAATVNDESISDYELRQRVALYIATSGINQQLNEQQKARIRSQILENLEAEKLQLQEAVKKKITVSPVEVDKRVNAMLANNHITIEQLRASLNSAGASEESLRAQITASIAWQKAVQDEYGDEINITPEMVKAELQRNAEGANKPHFHVMEIFLPVDNPEQDAKVKKNAEDIENQLHQGAPFAMVARQFSQHPTAVTGGDIGWVHQGQLAPELDREISKLDVGMITPPIRSTGGYYVLALRERQEPLGTKVNTEADKPVDMTGNLPIARLLFPVNPHAPKAELENVMNVANQIRERYQGCDGMDEIHKKLPGSIFMNLGAMKLADLSPQIQKALADTHSGEAAAPFFSEAGIEVIGRCDKRIEVKTAYVLPTKDEVEDQLFQTQIATLMRRYLRDLKREANIQVREDNKTDSVVR
jgi:peptidyl-prolyl cis-trans isomerase SurA